MYQIGSIKEIGTHMHIFHPRHRVNQNETDRNESSVTGPLDIQTETYGNIFSNMYERNEITVNQSRNCYKIFAHFLVISVQYRYTAWSTFLAKGGNAYLETTS